MLLNEPGKYKKLIMPGSAYPVNKQFAPEAILQIIVVSARPLKPQMGTVKQLTRSLNIGFWCWVWVVKLLI